jgi:DNA-binding NarL/FixJ family response regulator
MTGSTAPQEGFANPVGRRIAAGFSLRGRLPQSANKIGWAAVSFFDYYWPGFPQARADARPSARYDLLPAPYALAEWRSVHGGHPRRRLHPSHLSVLSSKELSLSCRVLLVDDHELWRRRVGAALRTDRRWQIVGEASDGLEAVEKAGVLKPDLILLDIGLPTLTGIEAARRIRALDPAARIVFLSEHRSWDVVEGALDAAAATGYIVKSSVGADLLSVLAAIVEGRRFISAAVVQPALTRATSDLLDRRTRCHEAGFYADETSLLDDYARFAGSALEAGHAVLFVSTRSRQEQLERRLRARGLDSDRARQEGLYLPSDLEERLSAFMLDGRIDDTRFLSSATSLLMTAASAAAGPRLRVAACGDGASTLWREGRAEDAIRVEQLWDQLARRYNIDVLCGYLLPEPGREEEREALQRICAAHSSVRMR